MAGITEISSPVMVPGTCFICTSGDTEDRRWLDMNVSPWKMGRLYICSLCVGNMADLLGLSPNNALAARVAELEVANERGNYAMALLNGLRTTFQSLDLESLADEQIIKAGEQGAKESIAK